MATRIKHDVRLDVELAVALEIGKLELDRAKGEIQTRAAMQFNLRLWQTIRRLAATVDIGDLRALIDSADLVAANWANPAAVAAHNAHHARVLAGRSATHGALKLLLQEWRVHRGSQPRAEFGPWLLARLDAGFQPMKAAA